ncbi:OmpH family outer membrane protein [Thiococcus pfennigii]|uniref:OmpH family outer membrane protein n=1 Tax=Thiococcus pfennigii TaxID=1057 RepID=UPI001F5B508E|nr:OmpH family outer membrane protein [Thiococcus pfennigii]
MRFLTLILLLAAAPLTVAPAADYSIAVIDANRVVEESPQYAAAGQALQGEVAERERALREQQEEIAKLQERLERDGPLMSEDEVQRLQNDIRSRQRRLKYAQVEFQEDFALRQNELRTKLAKQVQEAVIELAKEKGIDLILSEGVVYSSDRIDLSDEVIERLKQRFQSR